MRQKKQHSNYANIYDVAQKAEVSISTVSRVLNNQNNVNEETRQRVVQAIQELNFKPNVSARGLVLRTSNMIQMFFQVAKFPVDFDSNWLPDILNGAGEVLQDSKYGLILNTLVGLVDSEEFYKRAFHDGSLEGILMVAPHLEDRDVLKMINQRIPVVLVAHRIEDPRVSFVDTDNRGAVRDIVDHFVGLGHKRIACLAGPIAFNRNAQDRLEGFKEGLRKHGLDLPENYVIQSEYYTRDAGMEGMESLLKLPQRPTAVFGSNDLIALGAWETVEKAGLTVGKDVSLAGYDDIPLSSHGFSLTTVRQDFKAVGSAAAQILVDKIKNPASTPARQVFVPCPIVVRKSTGPAPRK